MIPTFGGQIEKAREATDIANLRSAYAQASAEYLSTGEKAQYQDCTFTQTEAGWGDNSGKDSLPFTFNATPTKDNTEGVTFTFSENSTTTCVLGATTGGGD